MSNPTEEEGKKHRCRYCPRFLTDPVSIARGAGPVCHARAVAAAAVMAGLEPKAKRRPRKTAGKGKGTAVIDSNQLAFPFLAVAEGP
jgi:hypothetical protein